MDITIQSKKSGKYLTVAGNSSQNGAIIVEESHGGMNGQNFRLQESKPGSGEFFIYTFCGKALDCCEGSKKNGTQVIQWDHNGEDNQVWLMSRI